MPSCGTMNPCRGLKIAYLIQGNGEVWRHKPKVADGKILFETQSYLLV